LSISRIASSDNQVIYLKAANIAGLIKFADTMLDDRVI
jgi:hypothetical protein